MCGIAGELNFDGRMADTDAVQRMTRQLARRGPDGAGMVHHGPRAFGHRRLRIMDLSDRAQQPMVDSGLGLGIVYTSGTLSPPVGEPTGVPVWSGGATPAGPPVRDAFPFIPDAPSP